VTDQTTTSSKEIGTVLIISNLNKLKSGSVKNTKFIEAISPISESVHLIAAQEPTEFGSDLTFKKMTNKIDDRNALVERILNYIFVQLSLFIYLVRNRNQYDRILLCMGYFSPAIVGRILGKPVIRYYGGPKSESPFFEQLLVKHLPSSLSHRIIVPANGCTKHFGLERYRNKIHVGNFHIDDEFKVNTKYKHRPRKIGFLGHISELKGIDRLVESMEIVNEEVEEPIELEIGGEGSQALDIDLDKDFVTYHGWLDHEETPDFYNQLRLFVLPSASEGLPTVLVESMACGTPVLATRVGGIPDLVNSGKNGYLLSDRDPDTIAEDILRIFNSSERNELHKGALETVDSNYRLDPVQQRFEELLILS
jgi:glycosyltransferase involved in cell wall biosynthesis